jgi:hypothetical protein
MRRRPASAIRTSLIALLLGGVAAAALAVPAGAKTSAAKRCATVGTTVAADESARVYRLGGADSYRAYACLARTGKVRSLGSFDEQEEGVRGFVLAGSFVAYERRLCAGEGGCSAQIRAKNIRTGATRTAPEEQQANSPAAVIVASESGAVGWLRVFNDRIEVRKLDTAGGGLLDTTPPGTLVALALGGNTLYWTNNGATRSAQLR